MAITERSRHEMIVALQHVLGEEPAMTLVEHLPPDGWSNVATRQDLESMEVRFDARFESMEARFDARFESIDARFESIDARFASMEARFDARMESMESRLTGYMGREFAAQSRAIIVAFVTALIGFGGLMIAAVSIAR